MKVYVVYNFKGGCGKTTSSNNLSVEIAKRGYKTLLVDVDIQANTSSCFIENQNKLSISKMDEIINNLTLNGFNGHELLKQEFINENDAIMTSSDILLKPKVIKDVIMSTNIDNLSLIPASFELAITEKSVNISTRFYNALKYVNKDYDYCFFDCPPGTDIVVLNAIDCASTVLIPVKPDWYNFNALLSSIDYITAANEDHEADDSREEIDYRIFFTMVDDNKPTKKFMEMIRVCYPGKVLDTFIRNSKAKAVNVATFNKEFVVNNEKLILSQDYRALCNELLSL